MKQVDFSDGRVGCNILQTALPMLVAQLVQMLYNIVDRIYIGRIPDIGTAALGAVGLCFPITIMILAFTNLYGAGGAPLCAIERGRGDRAAAERVMNLAMFQLVATSLVLIFIGEMFGRPLLIAFGASEENLAYALPYLRIYLLGTTFSMIASGLNPYINAQGFSETGMATVVIGAIANLILDPIFIFVFGFGVVGAAVATVISQLLSAVFVVRFLRGSQAELKLKFLSPSELRANIGTMREIVSLGLSSFVMQFTNALVSLVCNHTLAACGGDAYVSVMTVISSVRQLLDAPTIAIGDGSSPVISFNYGAKKPEPIRKAILLMTVLGIGYTAVMWGIMLWQPGAFIRIFTSDEELIRLAKPALHLYFFAFVFQAFQISGQTVFKSLNKKRRAIFFSLFRKVVLVVPLTLALPYLAGLGTDGVFMAEPISNFVGGLACFTTMLITILPEISRMGKETDVR